MKYLLIFLFALPGIVKAQNSQALGFYSNGVTLFYQEAYEEAINYFDKSIEADSSFVFAFFNRGLALEQTKAYKEAKEDFSHVIRVDSQYIDAYVHRIDCAIKLAQYEEAILDLDKLIAFNPSIAEPYKKLGLCYYYTRKYALSNTAYATYLQSYPDDEATWFQKGLSNFYYADFEKGIEDFSKVYSLNPNYTTALEWRGKCYQKANYIEKACSDWHLAVEKGLKSSQDYVNRYCFSEN